MTFTTYKTLITITLLIFIYNACAQVGIGTTNPKAILDIKVNNASSPDFNDGLLIPRIDNFPVTNPTAEQHGMLVYLTTDNSFYYWNNLSNTWNKLIDSTIFTPSWNLTGNSGTVSGTEFIGTTDNQALDFRTNNILSIRITTNGRIEVFNTNNSVYIGEEAGNSIDVTAINNTLIGHQAGKNITDSSQRNNTMVGDRSGTFTISRDNSFFGQGSGYLNTSGRNNTFIGRSSGENNTLGSYNTFLGTKSGNRHNTGDFNLFLGNNSGFSNQTGENNVFIGSLSGKNNNGSNNTFVGESAGFDNLNGSLNVFIGNNAGSNSVGSNKLFIDNSNTSTPLIYGEFDNDLIQINGNLGVGITPSRKMHIKDVLRLEPRDIAPLNPAEGDIYVNKTDQHIYCYLNGSWKPLD